MARMPTDTEILKERKMVYTVTLRRRTRFRLWLFCKLVIFATWVGGFSGAEFVVVEDVPADG